MTSLQQSAKLEWRILLCVARGCQMAIENFETGVEPKMIEFISEPNLVYLLLLAGLLGLFLELKNPGIIVPGAVSALCLLIVFGIQTLPLNGSGVFAIVAGFVALILEIYIASFGLLAVLGVSAILFGSHILFDSSQSPGIVVSRPLIWSVGIAFSSLVLLLASLIAKTQFLAWLRYGGKDKAAKLSNPDSGDLPDALHIAEVFEEIGLAQTGKVFYKGTYWNATLAEDEGLSLQSTNLGPNQAGTLIKCKEKVQIVGWTGLTAKVRPYQNDTKNVTVLRH